MSHLPSSNLDILKNNPKYIVIEPDDYYYSLKDFVNPTYLVVPETSILLKPPISFYNKRSYEFKYPNLNNFLLNQILDGTIAQVYDTIRDWNKQHFNDLNNLIKNANFKITYSVGLELERNKNYWSKCVRVRKEELKNARPNTEFGYYNAGYKEIENRERHDLKLEYEVSALTHNIVEDTIDGLQTIKHAADIQNPKSYNPGGYHSLVNIFNKAKSMTKNKDSEDKSSYIIAEAALLSEEHNRLVKILSGDENYKNIMTLSEKVQPAHIHNIDEFTLELFTYETSTRKPPAFYNQLTLMETDNQLVLE